MMRRKFWRGFVLFVLCILFYAILVYATSYDDPGDGWGSSTPAGSEESDGSDAFESAESADSTEGDLSDRSWFNLDMEMRIYCHQGERDADTYRFLVNNKATGYGGFSIDDVDISYVGGLFPFVPYVSFPPFDADDTSLETLSLFEKDSNGLYDWTYNPSLRLSTTSTDTYENAKLHRIEGIPDTDYDNWLTYGCIPFIRLVNNVSLASEDWFAFDSEGKYFDAVTSGPKAYYYNWLGYDIQWDESQSDCEAVGGNWTEEEGFAGYRCCGDDRMWIKNRAVNEEEGFTFPTLSDEDYDALGDTVKRSQLCLYGASDDGQLDTNINYDPSTDRYTCIETGFESYDSTLHEDDTYDDDSTDGIINSDDPFVFQGSQNDNPELETDIGKWSDSSNANPQFCYYEYNTSTIGESYQWINTNEAADKPVNDQGEEITDFANDADETLCEKYLGGTWTGAHCCGNKYDYEGTYGDSGYYDESFSETTPIYYDEAHTIIGDRFACVESEVIEGVNEQSTEFPSHTAQKTGTDGEEYELLNVNGTLFGCSIDDVNVLEYDWYKIQNEETTTTLITDDTNAEKCDVKEGAYICNYNYTDADGDGVADDPQWDWYTITTSDDEGDYVKDVLGYNSEDANTFTWSAPPWVTTDMQEGACCAGSRCWNGTGCVDEYTDYAYDADSDGEEEHYICNNGDWGGNVETKYDWYYDTDAAAIDYCVNPYSCVCSSNEDDDTFCVEEGDYYEAGCTLTPDFFKNDHFCEAIDNDGNGDFTDSTDSSQWTSRTKFLAFELMEIAETQATDYTLFCDNYTDTLNNYVNVEAIAEDINSFCILSQDDQVTIGVTFNSEDNEEPMTVDANEVLFDGSTAFVDQIVDNDNIDFSYCDNAIDADQTEYRFGAFFSCDSSTTQGWYNNKLQAFIYSKDGLSDYTSGMLTYSDTNMATYQSLLDTKKQEITDYIGSNTLENPAGDELNGDDLNYFGGFSYVEDYNKLYYSENAGTTTFGFEDVKYQEEYGNRYFLGVLYDGITLDCDQVYTPYETIATIYCNSVMDSDTGIVLERSTTGSSYWNSLTAAVRRG